VKPTEAAALLTVAAAFDNRKPDADAAQAWAMALDDLPFADCRDAIVAHYRKTADWLMPAHVITAVRAVRTSRLEDAPVLTPPPGPEGESDAEMVARQLVWLKEARRRIANGEVVDCDAGYDELKPRHLPDLRLLLPAPAADLLPTNPNPHATEARRVLAETEESA
jgi:hypothetical protein